MEHPKCPDCHMEMHLATKDGSVLQFGIPEFLAGEESLRTPTGMNYGAVMYLCTECGLIRLYSAGQHHKLHPDLYAENAQG